MIDLNSKLLIITMKNQMSVKIKKFNLGLIISKHDIFEHMFGGDTVGLNYTL